MVRSLWGQCGPICPAVQRQTGPSRWFNASDEAKPRAGPPVPRPPLPHRETPPAGLPPPVGQAIHATGCSPGPRLPPSPARLPPTSPLCSHRGPPRPAQGQLHGGPCLGSDPTPAPSPLEPSLSLSSHGDPGDRLPGLRDGSARPQDALSLSQQCGPGPPAVLTPPLGSHCRVCVGPHWASPGPENELRGSSRPGCPVNTRTHHTHHTHPLTHLSPYNQTHIHTLTPPTHHKRTYTRHTHSHIIPHAHTPASPHQIRYPHSRAGRLTASPPGLLQVLHLRGSSPSCRLQSPGDQSLRHGGNRSRGRSQASPEVSITAKGQWPRRPSRRSCPRRRSQGLGPWRCLTPPTPATWLN